MGVPPLKPPHGIRILQPQPDESQDLSPELKEGAREDGVLEARSRVLGDVFRILASLIEIRK